ncbi:MAG: hypothetical protein L3J96_04495, partial [Thermoplasmata archaeon]|nr:hypothetical protein [Thermoplasmata archaeon]
ADEGMRYLRVASSPLLRAWKSAPDGQRTMTEKKETPRDRMFTKVSGFEIGQSIYVVAKLGVADRLADGPKTAAELAAEVGAHPESLFRVMRFLASLDVFDLDEQGRFSLTAEGKLLKMGVPGSMVPIAVFLNEELYRAAGDLVHTVRTGETAFHHMFGSGQFEYLAANPDVSRTFNAAMSERRTDWEFLNSRFDFEHHKMIVDIGGGRGSVLAAILKENTRLNGLIFDFPHVLPEADNYLLRQGVRGRCRILGGSILDFAPGEADVYLAVGVFHLFSDDLALKALENIRRASDPDGSLLIVDRILPEDGSGPAGNQADLRMLYSTGGKERTEAEWRSLIEKAGLQFESLALLEGGQGLIIARTPPDR